MDGGGLAYLPRAQKDLQDVGRAGEVLAKGGKDLFALKCHKYIPIIQGDFDVITNCSVH